LPSTLYEYAEWKKARVNIDYHVEVNRHYYSVPYQLVREQVDIRLTATTVEILFKNKRVASHQRSYRSGAFITLPQHMPKSHQRYLEWTPSRIVRWAEKNGPNTKQLLTAILQSKTHPEQGFRSCLGIMRLTKSYSSDRVEAACSRALLIKAYSFRSVESILKKNLDQQPLLFEQDETDHSTPHSNVRGKKYYH
jgi:transposase